MWKNAYLFVSCSLGSPNEQKTPKVGMLITSQGAQSYYYCTSCSNLYEDYSNKKEEGSHQKMIQKVKPLILNYRMEKPITKVKIL